MTSAPTKPVARTLAEYIVAARPEDLPEAVRREGVRSFVNWLGCAIGGARHDSAAIIGRALDQFSGPPQATVLGSGNRYDMLLSSLLNCTSSSIYGFDDTHAEVIMHPTGPIAAPILALAEQRRISGADFILALVLGVEVECRLSRAVSIAPARCNVGWYMTGLTGGIGAAAAVGKLLELDVQQLVSAMGIAAGEASGLRAMHATMCSGLVPAHAGQTGLRAALLAQQGFTCSERFLEGPRGFLDLFAELAHVPALTEQLGTRFEILSNTYKPFPCGIVIHPIVDACLQIKSSCAFGAEDIARIDIKTHPTTITLTDRRHPKDDMEAIVSLYHWAAVAVTRGEAGLDGISAAGIADPVIVALRERVHAQADLSLAPDQAELTITLKDGTQFSHWVEHCIGSAARPMTDDELGQKFRGQALGVIDAPRLEALLKDCWRLADLTDVGALARASASSLSPVQPGAEALVMQVPG